MAWFQVSFFSDCLSRAVPLHVLIPADAEGAQAVRGRKYKTLYLLHGYSGSSSCWLLNGQVSELSQKYDLAIVMMSGCNGFYLDQPGPGNRYSAYIGQELVSFTRKLFPLSAERQDTMLGGLSMGGYGTIYNAFRYSGVFGHAIALSGAVTMDRLFGEGMTPEEKDSHLGFVESVFGALPAVSASDKNPETAARLLLDSGNPLPDLYMACGTDDVLCGDNRRFSAYLTSIGFPHVYEEGSGGHEWQFWRTYLERGVAHALAAEPDRRTVGILSDSGPAAEGGL